MSPLTAAQLEEIRGHFKTRRRALLQEVREALASSENQEYEDIIGADPGDAGDASVSDMLADLNLTLLDRHVAELREIEAAEARIAEGTYGQCVDCEGDIGYERLLAMPTAVRCVRCQEQYEKTHVTNATPSL